MTRPPPDFAFDRFVVQPGLRRLLVDGRPAKIGARAFDLLWLLIENRDRVIGKDELLERLWAGRVVEENNLQVQVSALRKLLGPAAIATIPGRGYRFTAEHAPASAPAPAAGDGRRHAPLPAPVGVLHGRDADLRTLVERVAEGRVATVVGPGGIGKTRLAIAAAHALQERFGDGAGWVDLSSVADPALVGTAVAQALGLTLPARRDAADEVADALRERSLLLVLDGCEHLVDAVGRLVAAVEARAPRVCVLATSRERLKVAGEHLLRLAPLAVPEVADADADADAAAGFGALALLAERIAALQPGFVIDARNVADAVDLCRRLDGLPLAIELAAARVPLLGLRGVRERLNDRLRMLTDGARDAPQRQQTLRETLDWSHGLLDDDERRVLRRAAVFAGSFGLDAAQRVLGDEALDAWAVLDVLGALVDKSLVAVEPGEPVRYRLLESTRAYAAEKLDAAPDARAVRRRHAEAMQALFDAGREQGWSEPLPARLERCLPDLDNLRAALDWTQASPDEGALHVALAGASAWLWIGAGLRVEGLRRWQQALARVDAATPGDLEARLQLEGAALAFPRAGAAERAAAQRAAALYRGLGDRRGLYSALGRLAIADALAGDPAAAQRSADEMATLLDPAWPVAARWPLLTARIFHLHHAGRHADAQAACDEAYRVARAAGDSSMIRTALVHLEQSAAIQGRYEDAVALGRELLERHRRDRFVGSPAVALGNLATALIALDRIDEALPVAREAAAASALAGTLWNLLDPIALLAFKRGRVREAALALGCAEAHHAWRGGLREPNEQRPRDELFAALRRTLPGGELQRLLAEGGALGDEAAARAALAD